MSRPRKTHYDTGGRPRCGHGTQISADKTAVTCEKCLDLLAGTYQLGQFRTDVKPCGTLAAVRRHYRRGEPVDETCRQAASRAAADKYARRTREQKGLAA